MRQCENPVGVAKPPVSHIIGRPEVITSDLENSVEDPSSIMNPWQQNASCDPFTPEQSPCLLGNYASYSIKVTCWQDVAAGIQFAQKKNIRLVVKNTGHEWVAFTAW